MMLAASGEATFFVAVVVSYKSELIGADPLSASMQIANREVVRSVSQPLSPERLDL